MHPKELRAFIKECVLEVLKEELSEGFDPTSQGPNPDCKDNPYPAWNSYMRQLEEEGEHGRGAQLAGAGEFDPRTLGPEPEFGPEAQIS